MPIYESQTLFSVILDTTVDITGASSATIKYEKPDGTKGVWEGSIYDTTKVKYDIEEGDLDDVGIWKVQAVVVLGGLTGYGTIRPMQVDSKL